ncbi:MAG: type II secretion system F family protein [Planctomycetota bacterium]
MISVPGFTDSAVAEQFEDLASRLDAGLDAGGPVGEAAVATLRRHLTLRAWEWSTLSAAESAGALPTVLRHLAAAHRERSALRREVAAALAYPAVVLAMCTLVATVVLATGVAPRGWLALTGGLLAALLAGALWLGWRLRDPSLEGDRLPVVGRLSRCAAELPYLVALRALYGAGVPLRQAHAEATPAAGVPWVRARLHVAGTELRAGGDLASALANSKALTAETLTLVRNGEAAGQLEDALGRAITRRREEYGRSLRRWTRLLGWGAYAYAALSVLWIALRFYGSYFAALGGGR